MEILKSIEIIKIRDGKSMAVFDEIMMESKTSIHLNGEKIISTMCTPLDVDSQAVGFFMSEGVIESVEDIENIEVGKNGLYVNVESKINQNNLDRLKKNKVIMSGGSMIGDREMEQKDLHVESITSAHRVEREIIFDMLDKFYREGELYNRTGCAHKAMLLLKNGEWIANEDVGRHNALDKVTGKARLSRINMSETALIVTSRLSSEMIMKVIMHKIPIVISRTAPTYLGIKNAEQYGLSVVGFARGRGMNIYTHKERIL